MLVGFVVAVTLPLPARRFDFVRDDHEIVEHATALARPTSAARLLGSDFWAPAGIRSGMWRPAVTAANAVDAMVGGGPPRFHTTNLVLHGLASAVVAALAPGFGAALAAGTWFATMPAHLESVAWVSGRTDVLCALFAGCALLFDRRVRRGSRTARVAAPCAMALAILAKETALLWPVVMFVDRATDSEPAPLTTRARWIGMVPYVAIVAAYAVAHAAIARPIPPAPWVTPRILGAHRLQSVLALPWLARALVPGVAHAADRMPAGTGSGAAALAAGLAITVMTVLALLWSTRRRSRWATPLAMFVVPAVSIAILAAAQGYLAVADRNVYMASMGVALLLGLAVERAMRPGTPDALRGLTLVAAAALVVVSALETRASLRDWRDDRAVYAAMVRTAPDQAEGHVGLANALVAEASLADATAELDRAERLEPRDPSIAATRARIAARRSDWPGELAEARRALALQPDRADAYAHEISALLHLGRAAEAESLLARRGDAVRRSPLLASLRGRALLALGRPAEALPPLETAVRSGSDDPSLWFALGQARYRVRRLPEARAAFERAAALAPGARSAWLGVAVTSMAIGDTAAARDAMARASASAPTSAAAPQNR